MCREVMWTVSPPLMQYAPADRRLVSVDLDGGPHSLVELASAMSTSPNDFVTVAQAYGPLYVGDVVEAVNGVPCLTVKCLSQILAAHPKSTLHVVRAKPEVKQQPAPSHSVPSKLSSGDAELSENPLFTLADGRLPCLLSWIRPAQTVV